MASSSSQAAARPFHLTQSPRWVSLLWIGLALGFLFVVVILPLVAVFSQAFGKGVGAFVAAIAAPETVASIKLTLLTAALVVPFNTVFGLSAAWLLVKFTFPGKKLLLTLVDLPFSVSPVISGLVFVLLFGRMGWFGPFLRAHHLQVLFSTPGIVLATAFVTFPFVAREVLPILQASGNSEEEAALTLGAGGWRIFLRVTLPKIKWGVLYGVILCNARAMGEFGAVSVVSGHIRGLTNTMPLQVEILYNEYDFVGAFAVASLLVFLAVLTLIGKKLVERRQGRPAVGAKP